MDINYSALPLTCQKTIPEDYRDIMGHMNVMWYTHLFDQATFAFFETFGMGAEYHTQSGSGSFALEQHTRYLAEVRVGEHIVIHSRALGRSIKRFHFIHFMLKDDGQTLSATTELIGTHIDMSIRRTSPLPAHLAAAFDELLAQHNRLGWPAPVCGAMQP
ncbi:MAG: thioesterase family protein [Anaerolineae bacterium]|nr:thioesterase family protein [Anaerolineae bacterium]